MNLKRQISRLLLRRMLRRFDASESALDRLFGQAVRLQIGAVADEDFRRALEEFYDRADARQLADAVRFAELRPGLDRPKGYKVGVTRLADDDVRAGGLRSRLSPWHRRFGLLQHLSIRCDVLILRKGEQVPPPGHNRVVSGFYLLEGRVACRNYDRVREAEGRLFVREALDAVLESGGHTTNSEFHHNIHWLLGLAPASYLFRVTVANTPTRVFGSAEPTNERVYVDPTGTADAEGLIRACYVTEEAAKRLEMNAARGRMPVAT
jgi:hypothetical protein